MLNCRIRQEVFYIDDIMGLQCRLLATLRLQANSDLPAWGTQRYIALEMEVVGTRTA